MRTDRALRRPSSESVGVMTIVDRQIPVKTLSSLAVGKKLKLSSFDQMKELIYKIRLLILNHSRFS